MNAFSVTRAVQREWLEALERHGLTLRARPGVHHVDVGLEYRSGRPSGRLALRIHVDEKLPDPPGPVDLDGRPLDVLVTRPRPHLSADDRVDPLLGGITITNAVHAFGVGTLGAIVFDRATGAPMLLSARHVLCGLDGGPGDQITQPEGGDEVAVVSRVARSVDAAVATLHGPRGFTTAIAGRAVGISELDSALVGTVVTKSGRTTGTTSGIVDGVSEKGFSVVPDPAGPALPGGEISSEGDSGAIWAVAERPEVGLGLHVAGEADPDPAAERAWAVDLTAVARELDISFTDPSKTAAAANGSTRRNAPAAGGGP
ncbi:hypothetical protein [Actinomycetospora chiangmaiensis]|uniref:hypothetical protein n=1 Tax=Actinomycetospora chiangmaiensis TaxID=402650 RepID=UPI0003A4EA08|nr:hypothetical protein [Actinomycetospora chiangmaiensis]